MERAEVAEARKRIHVLIVGAGCFGLSTAYHLLVDNESSTDLGAQGTAPWYKVTIIDASDVLPAPDAASTDLNKIVRTSYSDGWYTRFAKEAIAKWKEGTICGKDTYHESGVLVLGLRYQSTEGPDQGLTTPYADAALRNDREINARIEEFPMPGMARRALPQGVIGGHLFDEGAAYLNRDGGWASASKAMEAMLGNVKRLGGEILTGCKLSGISPQADGTSTVNLENGEVIHADMVVLTTGAWTPLVVGGIPHLENVLKDRLVATGQVVATLRPSPFYQQQLREAPVLLDWQSGFYMFPPNEEGVIKIAIHAEGHTFAPGSSQDDSSGSNPSNLVDRISRPRTVRTHGEDDGTRVPRHILQRIHAKLEGAYPELGKVALETTRLCWYTESPDENWFIDQVPGHPTLFIATGGSGHAFKFLPVIGRLVKERIEGRLRPEDAVKFSLGREFGARFRSRLGEPVALDEGTLWGPKEFNIARVTEQSV